MNEWNQDFEKRSEENGMTSPSTENYGAVPPAAEPPVTPPVEPSVEPPAAPPVEPPAAPPVAPPAAPPVVPPMYRPTYQPSPVYRPQPSSPYGQPTPPPAPRQTPPPKKKGNAAIVVLSVLCAVSLLVCAVLGVMIATGGEDTDTNNAPSHSNTPSPNGDDANDGGNVIINENGPTLEISDIADANDGGLSTAEIVARNLDATVVLTMYTTESVGYGGFYGGMGTDGELV